MRTPKPKPYRIEHCEAMGHTYDGYCRAPASRVFRNGNVVIFTCQACGEHRAPEDEYLVAKGAK